MITRVANSRGLNVAIDQLQSWLQGALFPLWGIDPDDAAASALYQFYPLVYRNQDPQRAGYLAELYVAEGEYKEVFWDDALKGLSFFGQGPKTLIDGNENKVEVHLVTFANLKKLYPLLPHRADNEIRLDFQKIFAGALFGFELVSTEIWLANVLREYPGSRREDRLLAADMGDTHAFRLNLTCKFNPDENCT